MLKSKRISLLLALAQTKITPLGSNYSSYLPIIQALPNINLKLFSNIDWQYLSKIIGIIDFILVDASNSTTNFRIITVSTPSINTSEYANSKGLTTLIQLSQYIYKTMCVKSDQEYSAQNKLQFVSNISDMVNNSNIALFAINSLQDPKGTLLNNINAWKSVIK